MASSSSFRTTTSLPFLYFPLSSFFALWEYISLQLKMQRRLRQVFTSIREHSTVSYAKLMTIGGFCDLHLIVVKATSPDDLPLPERYVRDLLKIFSISPSSYQVFSLSFICRFSKTKCWRVALKCLLLLHRLLRALPDDTPLRTELLCARSNGCFSLYPCHFRDYSSSASEDYTIFIRCYAHLLHEALDCMSIDRDQEAEEGELPESLPDKMKEIGRMLDLLPQVQSLTDRAMDCRPTGAAAWSFLVQSAMKYIIRDSFICYTTFRKEIVVLLDHLIQMPYRSSIAAFGIYKKAALQANQLCEFYDWCKSKGICGLYEYPFIDRIPEIQIKALGHFLDGMWQLTESSSSATSPLTNTMNSSPTSSKEENSGKELIRLDAVASYDWANFEEHGTIKEKEKDEERPPLIQLDVDLKNADWEALLEASIGLSLNGYENYIGSIPNADLHAHYLVDERLNEERELRMQVYNPYSVNLNHQTPRNYVPLYHRSVPCDPTNSWML